MMKVLIWIVFFASSFIPSNIPPINQKIVDFVKSKEGKQIDRGECWDLAKAALDDAKADWAMPYEFGKRYDFKKDTILPGDIIQFENVVFRGELYSMSMPHHTAIVVDVLSHLKLKIAHQNFAGKRTVQFTEVNFNDLKKGKAQFYRPKE
ncbi:MAG: hypothetical protein H7329_00145 [Opitutaceae bacterium]|nr:hypothetical protein [Cytophagales bacterium]